MKLLGSPRDPLSTVIPMTLVYILILITGLFGNLCTCVVIVKNRYMHTTVNFYLFSLAVSDLLLLIVGLPTELWTFWQKYPYVFGETFCILRALISEACSYASVLTITAFTVERYIAICHPLKAHTMTQLSRAVKAILFIWVLAVLASIPISLQLGIIYQVVNRFLLLLYPCNHLHIISFTCVRPDLFADQETTVTNGNVWNERTTSLRVCDFDSHFLCSSNESYTQPLLLNRTPAETQFEINGS